MKTCSMCNTPKDISNFYKNGGLGVYRAACKSCTLAKAKIYHELNPEQRTKTRRKRYLANIDYEVNARMVREYGITLEEYKGFIKNQNNKCKVCGVNGKLELRGLYIDHCHTTGIVRGLLCAKCNFGIGALGDNIESVLEAYKYLVNAYQKPLHVGKPVTVVLPGKRDERSIEGVSKDAKED